MDGWSRIWNWGGGYGDAANLGLSFRLLMGPGDGCGEEYRDAYFTMDTNGSEAHKITLEHLDGSQNDNFDVYLYNDMLMGYELLGNYESQGGNESWVTSEFEFTPRSGVLQFKVVSTGDVTDWCSNWGQVAFSNASVEGTYHWTYFVKIVAAPSDATSQDGNWYLADGTLMGPEIWGEFAIVQEVSNDAYADQHGLQNKGVRPGLGNWEY